MYKYILKYAYKYFLWSGFSCKRWNILPKRSLPALTIWEKHMEEAGSSASQAHILTCLYYNWRPLLSHSSLLH